jgi:tRNA (guanine37-N1)-methyltransferase
VDQRVSDHLVDGELSVGDFVLAGGELGALVVIEAVACGCCPSVLGNEDSALEESFSDGPARVPPVHPAGRVPGLEVPEVLRSGDHGRRGRLAPGPGPVAHGGPSGPT